VVGMEVLGNEVIIADQERVFRVFDLRNFNQLQTFHLPNRTKLITVRGTGLRGPVKKIDIYLDPVSLSLSLPYISLYIYLYCALLHLPTHIHTHRKFFLS